VSGFVGPRFGVAGPDGTQIASNLAGGVFMRAQLKQISVAFGVATMFAIGVNAQEGKTKTTTVTTIELKGGKDVEVRGCLERNASGEFMLTDVREAKKDERLAHNEYNVVSDVDLADHVGKRVEIKGKAVENGKGKVQIESKVKTENEHRADETTTTKTEATSGNTLTPYLGVKSIKTLSASCR
jgi:hypothetical protein